MLPSRMYARGVGPDNTGPRMVLTNRQTVTLTEMEDTMYILIESSYALQKISPQEKMKRSVTEACFSLG